MKSISRPASTRNLQLDFFRGLALMIIFINHMPGNPWSYLTPSRLGPSDSAETFVFLSGFVAAIAYGRSFKQAGIGLGSIQILFRCGQIYLAHLSLFLFITSLFVLMNVLNVGNEWRLDNLNYFFNQTQVALLALVSLTYVPNYLDILPMYLVILLWVPMVWALSRLHTLLAVGFSIALYIAAWTLGWELTADPISGRHWYFNPFCWQLVFFTGFAFSSGWLPIPRFHQGLMWACISLVIFCLPLGDASCYQLPWFIALAESWASLLDKSHLGFVRYLHFLALAYLVRSFMLSRQHWLNTWLADKIICMGRQSLPTFMIGTGLSLASGMLLESTNGNLFDSACINLAGLGLMMLIAQLLNWLEQKPWKISPENNAQPPTFVWSHHAVTVFSLLILTIAPLLFLQSQSTQLNMTESPSDDLALTQSQDLSQDTKEAAFEHQETILESPDTL